MKSEIFVKVETFNLYQHQNIIKDSKVQFKVNWIDILTSISVRKSVWRGCILCKCSIVGDALDHRGEDGEPEAKAFDLPVDLWSAARCWSRAVGCDRKNEIMDTSGWNGFPLQGAWVQSQRRRLKEPVQVVWPTDYIPLEVFQGGRRPQVWPGTDSRTPLFPQGGAGNTKQNMDVNDMNAMKEQSGSVLLFLDWMVFFSSHKVTLTSTHRTVFVSLLSDAHLLEQTPANGYMAFTHRTVCFCSRRIQAIFVLYLSILASFGCVITLRTAMSRRDAVSAHY